jgi:phenylacetate-coenzyme A ligase PaaK-like adenylate-forming protein
MTAAPIPLFSTGLYDEPASSKRLRLLQELNQLTRWHAERCEPYRRILNAGYAGETEFESLEQLPALPAPLFKTLELASVDYPSIVRTLVSSGTTRQRPSKIFLDKATAIAQTRALAMVVKDVIAAKRLPMAIIDYCGVLRRTDALNARGAGVLGFSQFGYDHTYLLDDTMELNIAKGRDFTARHQDRTILLFGFTSLVWEYLYCASVHAGIELDLSNGVLIHGGGWKRLEQQHVCNEEFKTRLHERFGISRIHNYYGMVEQTGSIFMECEHGHLHTPPCGDVLVRHPVTFEPLPFHQPGILQVMSTVPRSYPGHVILTEDVGVLLGEDDCPCLRRGKYFHVEGRLAGAELRGCSDVNPWG